MREEVYKVTGMACAGCSANVEEATRKLSGVVKSEVNLAEAEMTISYDEEKVSREEIMKAVTDSGYGIK